MRGRHHQLSTEETLQWSADGALRERVRSECRKRLDEDSKTFAVEVRDSRWNLVEVVERESVSTRRAARRPSVPPVELTAMETTEWHADTPSGGALRDDVRALCRARLAQSAEAAEVEIRDFGGRVLERVQRK